MVIVLDTYYPLDRPAERPQLPVVRDLYCRARANRRSCQQMHNTLIPGLLTLLEPLLPADVSLPAAERAQAALNRGFFARPTEAVARDLLGAWLVSATPRA